MSYWKWELKKQKRNQRYSLIFKFSGKKIFSGTKFACIGKERFCNFQNCHPFLCCFSSPTTLSGDFQQIAYQEFWTQWHWGFPAQEGSIINSSLSRWCCLASFTLTFQRSMWREPPDSAEAGRAVRPVIMNQSLLLLREPVTEHRW